MIRQPFSLRRFAPGSNGPTLDIIGDVSREADTLTISYRLSGELQRLDLPSPTTRPERREQLWRHSCFELFIAAPGQPGYHEFNLSPSGDWNCYRFSAYRLGMITEPVLNALPFSVDRQPNQLQLSLAIDLSTLLPANSPLDIGITAVIQQSDSSLSYWALHHPGNQPDFHHRDGFTLHMGPA